MGAKKAVVIGWWFALPVLLLLMYAPDWSWVIAANVFLGINQGLSWSSTVVVKIDLVREKNRGLAMGINEFAGYLAVGILAFFTSWIAAEYGLRHRCLIDRHNSGYFWVGSAIMAIAVLTLISALIFWVRMSCRLACQ